MGRSRQITDGIRGAIAGGRRLLTKWGLRVLIALVILGFIVWAAISANKSAWDVLELLIVPLALAAVAIWFNNAERQKDREIAADQQHEAIWQAYLGKMEELLKTDFLEKSMEKKWELGDKSNRDVAQVRTITAIRTLNKDRRNMLIQFLHDSGLGEFILEGASLPNVDLAGNTIGKLNLTVANLREANLSGSRLLMTNLSVALLHMANLSEAIISGANLKEATLAEANLKGAFLFVNDLSGADLEGANLRRAKLLSCNLTGANLTNTNLAGVEMSEDDLTGADLTLANLKGAKVTAEQLAQAKSLKGATMPDGTVHK